MPTGYTAAIADDITFKQFAMNCARAFGACITLRDEPGGDIIPEQFVPDVYHLDKQEEARVRLRELEAMSAEEAICAMLDDYEEREVRRLRYLRDSEALKAKYEAMLDHIENWQPHAELNGLRDFMLDQVRKSIEFDCGGSYYSTPTPKESSEAWKIRQLQETKQNLDYHIKGYAEEVIRVGQRNYWLKLLRDSLQD